VCAAALAAAPAALAAAPVVYSGTGAQQVASAVAGFEAAIGGADNGTTEGPLVGGFRTLNWDDAEAGVMSAHPGLTPGGVEPSGVEWLNFRVANERGLDLATPGPSVEVSNDGFRDLSSSYPALLASPTGPNAFGPLGSTETDLTFEVPDSHTTPWNPVPQSAGGDSPGSTAAVAGFGATFMNVEAPGTSSIDFLAGDGHSLGSYPVPTGPPGAPEFLGVLFDEASVAAVRITSGTVPLSDGVADDGGQHNVVALGDLVSSEPLWGPSVVLGPPGVAPGSAATMTGTTSDPIGVPSVTVAGVPATVSPGGAWTATLPHLADGTQVEVVATDSRGLSASVLVRAVDAPSSGRPAPTKCRVALAPAVVTIPDLTSARHPAQHRAGSLTVRATCDHSLRGVITADVTALPRATRHRRGRPPTHSFVLRAQPIALTAGESMSQTIVLPYRRAVQLVRHHPRVMVGLTLWGIGATRATAVAASRTVRVARVRPVLSPPPGPVPAASM
jgi:hypothetical protein